MANFSDDNIALDTALYAVKSDVKAVTSATTQVSKTDLNNIRTALGDLRTVQRRGVVNVKEFGALGDGVQDDTIPIQAALAASQGRTLYLPKGKYRVTSTLFVTTRSNRIVGDFANRSEDGGTEISFSGTGPCIQIHTDSGNAWNSNEYDGRQDQVFENLWFRHSAPDTALVAAGDAVLRFKLGAYGIWDWRGGQIVLSRVGFEQFEASFVGIQSDINAFDFVSSHYSKFGIYIGPRSDQFSLHKLYSFFCDRAVTIDGATDVRIVDAQIVGCGTTTSAAVEVRNGSSAVVIDRPWLEHLQGYQGTDQLSFVSAGEVTGYSSGGSIQSAGSSPNTNAVEGLAINDPFCFTVNTGIATHTRFVVSVNKCHRLSLARPQTKVGNSLTNFDALVGVQAANAPTNAETQIAISGASSGLALADLFSNLGAGSPALSFDTDGPSGKHNHSTQRWSFLRSGAAAGAEEFQLSQEGNSGEFWVITPNHSGGQTERLRLARHMGTQTNAAAPSSGTYVQGDWKRISDPSAAGYMCWVCVVGGTPGTWVKAGLVTSAVGFAVADPFIANKGVRFPGELAAPQLTGNVNDYSPTGLTDTFFLLLTSSINVDITGIALGGTLSGRWLWIYNNGANNITLKHESASSSAANRFLGTAGADVVLTPKRGAMTYYSPSLTRLVVGTDNL